MEDTTPKFLESVTEHPDVQRLIKQVNRGDKKIKELQAENKRLKKELEKHRWIPVAERLPELGDMYQVLRKHNQYPTTREYMETLKLWDSHDTITHWKEITKP